MRKFLFLSLLAVGATACIEEPDDEVSLDNAYEAYPGEVGEIRTVTFETPEGPVELEVEVIDGQMILEGDMILPEPHRVTESNDPGGSERAVAKSIFTMQGSFWPGGVVPFTIDPNLPNPQRVLDAISHWQSQTVIRFVPRTNQPNWVNFTPASPSTCSSSIGMQGGCQDINLGSSCTSGITIHEIGHAVGLLHEQSRADASNYVTLNYNNIADGKWHNFTTYGGLFFDDIGTFDFNSIMLYGSFAFSKNNLPTLVKKDGTTYNAQRTALGSQDKLAVLSLYGVINGIKAKWIEHGAYQGILGAPLGPEFAVPGGAGNHFERGSIFWSLPTNAHEVHGDILSLWMGYGLQAGVLGFPTTDQQTTSNGVGRFNDFQGGSIYWTPSTGANAVINGIHAKWTSMGREQSFLGFPTTNELSDGGAGRYNNFEGGSIYWSHPTGMHEIHGQIRTLWLSLGGGLSSLGYPTSDEIAIGGGGFQDFQGGRITWYSWTGPFVGG